MIHVALIQLRNDTKCHYIRLTVAHSVTETARETESFTLSVTECVRMCQ